MKTRSRAQPGSAAGTDERERMNRGAAAIRKLQQKQMVGIAPSARIGHGAHIHPTANIGKNSEVGAYSTIGKHVRIGARVRIGTRSEIGARTVVCDGTAIGDKAIVGAKARIEPDVSIGAKCVIRSSDPLPETPGQDSIRIGQGSILGTECWIDQDTRIEPRAALGDGVELGRACLVRTGARIGNRSKLGDYGLVGAGSEVGADVIGSLQTGIADGCTVGDRTVLTGVVLIAGGTDVLPDSVIDLNTEGNEVVKLPSAVEEPTQR